MRHRGKKIKHSHIQEVTVQLMDGRSVLARVSVDLPALAQDMIERAHRSPRSQSKLKNGIVLVELVDYQTALNSVPGAAALSAPIGPNHNTHRKHVRTEPLGKLRTEPLDQGDQARRTEQATRERMGSDPGTRSLRSLFRGL